MNNLINIVYMTINLINNKIYIGVHQTFNPNDNYLGSGTILKNAFKKYGKRNFEKHILYECSTPQEAYDIENLLVNEEFLKRPNVYNRGFGGLGGRKLTLDIKQKLSKIKTGQKLSATHKANIGKSHLGRKK